MALLLWISLRQWLLKGGLRQGGSGTCIMKSAERASYGSEEDWS